jgi:protein TonB
MPGASGTHVDLLDDRESLRNPLVGSLLLHAAMFALIPVYAWYQSTHSARFGSQDPIGGGSVGIDVSKTIQLPRPAGQINPLANDTESQVPRPDKPEPKKKAVAEEKDAIPLLKKKALEKKRDRVEDQMPEKYHARPVLPNQVTSTEGQRLITNMVQKTGAGGIGANTNSALGNQFGWYLDLVKQRIAQRWDTGQVDGRVQTAPPVIADFDISRDGNVTNLRIIQSSGLPALDFSAQRAILQAAPFPALPGGYSSSPMEILFQLKR